MLSVQTLAKRIRARLHDTDSIAYDDEWILDCINNGVRFIRRIIADIRPDLLMSATEGVIPAGTKSITLEKRPTRIINVTAGDRVIKTETYYTGKKIYHDWDKIYQNHNPIYNLHVDRTYSERFLRETSMAFIIPHRSDKTGPPREFFLTGSQTINFFPIPNWELKYTVRTIDDVEELTWSDNSPFNTEYDDFLVEYASIRLSVGNEFDMSQENQLLSNIIAQIQALLIPPPSGVLTKPYWNPYYEPRTGDWRWGMK